MEPLLRVTTAHINGVLRARAVGVTAVTALVSFVAAASMALVHLFGYRLRFLDLVPRSRWLSLAGGISVAYVFVHLLPELARSQSTLVEAVGQRLAFLEHHVYLIALLGLITSYGLERVAASSRERERGQADRTSAGVFWLHVSAFAVYNALVGYLLLHRAEQNLPSVLFFAVAMALHLLVNDVGLRRHHKAAYASSGRWVLATAVVLGWAVGLVVDLPEVALGVLFAFLAGGVILNVLKEELPEERQSRFGAFAAGAAIYTVLLLAV